MAVSGSGNRIRRLSLDNNSTTSCSSEPRVFVWNRQEVCQAWFFSGKIVLRKIQGQFLRECKQMQPLFLSFEHLRNVDLKRAGSQLPACNPKLNFFITTTVTILKVLYPATLQICPWIWYRLNNKWVSVISLCRFMLIRRFQFLQKVFQFPLNISMRYILGEPGTIWLWL